MIPARRAMLRIYELLKEHAKLFSLVFVFCYNVDMPNFQLTTGAKPMEDPTDICLFGQTFFRNQLRRFGIKTDDRRRHMYVIGKTGMGKTTVMENMVLSDIYRGHGVGIVDPHGDFAEKILDFIPPGRINDVVYFNPADIDHPIGFNVLEVKSEEQKHLIAAGLMGIFKKIWPDVWSSRMEYILNNTLLALLDYPGSTLLGINRLLSDKDFRKKVVTQLTDPVIKSFWQNEFASYNDRYAQEAVAPIQNKIGQFLSSSVIRNMVAQVTSTINIREIMDSRKILIMNLSKGRIGEDNSRLLGGMLITKIQLAAMERVDTPEKDRKDFFLYVDEFQNFATPSFANILSEARKYRLSLIMAHQYVLQLDEVVAAAVFGNVGTIMAFRVGGGDAEALAKEFAPVFMEEDIVNLAKYRIILKLMIDGVASQPFSAMTMPPIGSPTGVSDRVVRVSRERYAKSRAEIEDKIIRWSGMAPLLEEDYNKSDIDTTKKPKIPSQTEKIQPTLQPNKPVRTSLPVSSSPSIPNSSVSLASLLPKPTPPIITQVPKVIPTAPTVPSSNPVTNSVPNLPALNPDGTPRKKRHRKRKKSGNPSADRGSNYGSENTGNGNSSNRSNNSPSEQLPKTVNPAPAPETPRPIQPIQTPPPPTDGLTGPNPISPKQVIEF